MRSVTFTSSDISLFVLIQDNKELETNKNLQNIL